MKEVLLVLGATVIMFITFLVLIISFSEAANEPQVQKEERGYIIGFAAGVLFALCVVFLIRGHPSRAAAQEFTENTTEYVLPDFVDLRR